MKIFLYTLIAISTALFVAIYFDLASDPGYFMITWRNNTFETSLLLLAAYTVSIILIARLLFLLLNWVNPWQLIRHGRKHRRRQQMRKRTRTTEGLLHFARSNYSAAFNSLEKSFTESDVTVVNYLAAAYAAYAMKRKDLWIDCLDRAAKEFPVDLSTINSVRGELLLRSNQLEQSVAVLEQLLRTSIHDNHLLELLKEVYLRLEDWGKLRELLPKLRKDEVLAPAEIDQLESLLLGKELADSNKQARTEELPNTQIRDNLLKIWKNAPQKSREDAALVSCYAKSLIEVDAGREAAREVETTLTRAWSDDLVTQYGLLQFPDSAQQLAQGEAWLQGRPENAALLLALGRIAMRNQLWGKARQYFETSVKVAPKAEVHAELARLFKSLGESELSQRHLEEYQELSGASLPDLPLPESIEQQAV